MVAVITGNGLGLGNTSLSQLGQAQGGSPSLGQAANNSYVNTATGNLVLQSNDEGLLFDGLPLNILRTYNSLGQLNGSDGWSYGFSRNVNGLIGTLNTVGSSITRTDDDGSSVVYTYNASLGVYVSGDQSGAVDTLSWNATASTWTWTDAADSLQETYNATGQLTALADSATGASYSFSYSNGQLSQIVAGDGDTLIFGYNTSNQLISLSIQEVPPGQSTAVTRQAVSYGYDSQGRLTSVTTTLGSDTDSSTASYTTTYTYQGTTDLISSVTQSDGTTASYTYDASNQVQTVTTGTGAAAQTITLSYGANSTTATDSVGNATQYQYNAQGQLTEVIAPAVNGSSPTTTYNYDANGNLLSSTDPNGANTTYTYDANGNLLSVEDGVGDTVSYTYNSSDQVTSKTTYTVPAQGEVGQSGYVAPSGARTTYYVYTATNQLAYSIDPLGDVSENDYTTVNGVSELTTTRQYMGASYSTSGNNPDNPPALSDLQAWVQTSAVQSTLSQSTRVDYSYDVRGQLATQTQYDTVDASGNGVLTNGTVITTTTYDAQGRLLQTSAETGANRSTLQTTTYAYDGMGRMISKTDPLGNVTSYVYTDNGSNDTLVITQANGLVTTQLRNSAGLLVSSTQSSLLGGASSTLNYEAIYNTAGQTVAVINPDGSASYTFYNAQGQIEGRVSSEGNVTSYAYDSNGNLLQTVAYATPVSTSGWIESGALSSSFPTTLPVPTPSSSDLISTSIYDSSGHVVATVAPNGDVVQNIYNSAGQLTSSIAYATPLTATDVTQLGSAPSLTALLNIVTTSSNDQITLTIYNSNGQVYAVVDGSGNVTLDNYDDSGNRIASVSVSKPLTTAQLQALRSDTTMAALQADLALNQGAQTNLSIYNQANQVAATVSPGGVVTEMTYDSSGRVTASTVCGMILTPEQRAMLTDTPTLATLQSLIAPSSGDSTSLTIYTAAGQIAATVNGAGRVTAYTYDAAGNELSKTVYGQLLTVNEMQALGNAPTMGQLSPYLQTSYANEVSLTIYDADENVVATIAPALNVYDPTTGLYGFGGEVTTNIYDASGNALGGTQYVTALTASQMEALGTQPTYSALLTHLTSNAGDQTNLTIYDANGNAVGIVKYGYGVNAQTHYTGYGENVVINNYDASGRLLATTQYYGQITAAQAEQLASNPTIANLQSMVTPNAADQTTITIYNDDGTVAANVAYTYQFDPATSQWGYFETVTTTAYDADGYITGTATYANPLTEQQAETLAQAPTLANLQSLLASNTAQPTSFTVYSTDGSESATVTYEGDQGQVTVSHSDAQGWITAQIQYSNWLSADQLSALGTQPSLQAVLDDVIPSTDDEYSFGIYDANENLVAEIDPQWSPYGYIGEVTTYTYDAASGGSSATQYANTLTNAQMQSLGMAPTLSQLDTLLQPSEGDQISLTINSADGSTVASIQPWQIGYDGNIGEEIYGGQVTITTLDDQGNVINRATLNETLSQGQLRQLTQTPTWAALEAQLPSSSDMTITDAEGRVVATVDSSGNVQMFAYNGNTTTTTTYLTLTPLQQRELAAFPTLATLTSMLPSAANTTGISVLGSNGQVLGQVSAAGIVTLMTYDAAGHQVGTTQFATPLSAQQMEALAATPSLGALQMDLEIAEGDKVAQTLYDAQGRPVASISVDGSVVTTAYDAAGNPATVTQYANALNSIGYVASYAQLLSEVTPSLGDATTRTIYDSDHRAVAVIDTNGYVTLNTYDADGNIVSQTKDSTPLTGTQLAQLGDSPTLASLQALLTPTTQYIYNAAGQQIATIDPQGNASYTFYNADGQISGEVNADGDVTTYLYDRAGNVIQTGVYNFPLNTSSWLSGGDLTAHYPAKLPASSGYVYITTTVYDADGRKVATIDPADYVTTFAYDGTGDLLATTQYATALTDAQRSALGITPTWSALQADLVASSYNRTTLAIYDVDGRKVASIDADGYVTIAGYNAAGEQVLTTAYARALTSTQLTALGNTPTLAALQADLTVTAQDQTTRSYYDAAGRLVAQIDADGYLTTTSYDATTLTDTTTRYATALTNSQLNALTGSETAAVLVGLLGGNTANEQSSITYNGDGKVASSTAVDGTITTYTYNATGLVLSTTVTPVSGQGTARTTSATYDVYGNMLTSTDATGATTTYAYDTLGRKIETTDAAGNSTWYYYDAAGLLLYTVQGQPDPDTGDLNTWGDVSAYVYNAFGEVTQNTSYTAQLALTTGADNGSALNPTGATTAQIATAIAALQAANGGAQAGISTYTRYDNDGRAYAVTDGDNYTTQYMYDAFGDVIQQSIPLNQNPYAGDRFIYSGYDNDGRRTMLGESVSSQMYIPTYTAYDAFGRVISSTDGNGNYTSYTYDNLGRQVSTSEYVQGLPRTTQTAYDAFGHVLTITDALGKVTTYQYDVATHTAIVTTPDGVAMTTVKDAYGDTVSVTDGAGNTTTYTYDADGRLLTTEDALGDISTNQYDTLGELIQTTDATGNVVAYSYDASGRVLTKAVDPAGLDEVTSYAYDGAGRLLSITDPLGTVTTYGYDDDGNVLTMVEGAGPNGLNLTTTYTYDASGDVLTVTQAVGTSVAVTTQYVYDHMDRLVSKIVDPNGLALTTQYVYDSDSNLVEVVDPDGNTTYTVYNESGAVVYTITPAGQPGSGLVAVTQNSYDADGHLVATRVYSTLASSGQLSVIGIGAGNEADISAVANSVHSSSTDATTYYVYNADGQQIYKIDPLGNVTETRYNQLGQVAETLAYAAPISLGTTQVSALQRGTASAASIQALLAIAGDGDASARVTYSYYDTDGRLVYTAALTQVNGVLGAVVSQTQYDAAGRVAAAIIYGEPLAVGDVGGSATTASISQVLAATNTAATTRSTQYLYDSAGRQVAVVDPNGVASYAFYDAAGRVIATVDGTGAVTEYVRDDMGRVLRKMMFDAMVDTSGWIVDGEVQAGALPAFYPGDQNIRIVDTAYDALGRVSSVTTYSSVVANGDVDDAVDGDELTYTYDAGSRVVATNDLDLSGATATRVTRMFYDADGNTIATLDANGHLTRQAYDAAGQLTQTVAYATPVNPALAANGTLTQLTPASSSSDQVTTRYYDARGNLAGTLDADGYFTGYTYDVDGNQLTATRYATALNPNASLSLADITTALATSAYQQDVNTYDAYGDLLSSQDAQGTVTTYAYDNAGNVLQKTVAAGTGDAQETSYAYDAFGNVASTTDGLGNTTSYTYDLAGNKTSMTDALGNTTWYVYDAGNRLCYIVRGIAQDGLPNVFGEVTAVDYDAFGDVLDTGVYSALMSIGAGFTPSMVSMQGTVPFLANRGTNPDNWVGYDYDLEGNAVGKYDGNGNSTSYIYDGFNELVSSEQDTADGLVSLYAYDGMGNMISEIDEVRDVRSCGEFVFAAEEEMANSGGGDQILREQNWTYDAFGNVASYTDGDGVTTSYAYDNLDQQLNSSLTVSGAARATSTSYDAYGRVLGTTDAMGLVTTYSYNDADRSVTVTSPDGTSTTTYYTRDGQVASVIDATDQTTSYQYDADGRLLETTNPDGSTISNQYDAVGNLLSTTDADGNVTAYTYDADGRVLTKAVDPDGLNLVTAYTYDGRGLKMSETDPNGAVTSYLYDGNGNVSQMTQDASTPYQAQSITTTYQYDASNDLTFSDASEAINGTYEDSTDVYQYDALGRMTYESQSTDKSVSVSYTYDADGNVTSKSVGTVGYDQWGDKQWSLAANNTTYYFYDEAGELIYTVTPTGINLDPDETAPDSELTPTGAVTQNWYNADGQLVATTQYATELSLDDMVQLENGGVTTAGVVSMVTTSAADRTTYQVYNAVGQLQYSIDPNGAVVETQYNDVGQMSETLAYGNPIDISPALADSLKSGTAVAVSDVQSAIGAAGDSSANARVTYTYYDDMGRTAFLVRSTVPGEAGLVTGYQYDADGNVVAQMQYGSPLSQGTWTTALIAQNYVDAAAQVTRSVYDAAGREVYSVDNGGYVTEMQYDNDGRILEKIQYANAIAAPASWTQANVASAIQAVDGDGSNDRWTDYLYDDVGNLIYINDPVGNITTYTYDERGLKLSATDGDGNTTTYRYDQYGNLIQQNSPPVAVAIYGSDGALVGTTMESIVTTYQYDNSGNLISKTEANGSAQARTTQYDYDSANNLFDIYQPDPGAIDPQTGTLQATGSQPTTSFTYDAFGDVTAIEDPNGNTSYNVYDNDGNLIYAIDGDGYVTGYTYNTYGEQTGVTHYAVGIDIAAQSWSLNQPPTLAQVSALLVSSSADRTTTTTYDNLGNQISVTGPTVAGADNNAAAGGAAVTEYTYDTYGNVTSQSVLVQGTAGAAGAVWATTYSYYDAVGNKLMSIDPMGYVTAYTYDGFGEVISTTRYTTPVDTSGLVAGAAEPALPTTTSGDRVTAYTYDFDGNVLTKTIDPEGLNLVTSYTYDGRGLMTSETDPAGIVTQYTYDGNGNLTQVLQDADGVAPITTTDYYDEFNELVQSDVTQSSGDTTETASSYYTYDGLGRVVSETLDTGHQTQVLFSYDANGNVIATTDGDGNVSYAFYDGDNQQIYSVAANGAVTATTYSAEGQVTSTTQYAAEIPASSMSQLVAGDAGSLIPLIQPTSDDRTGYSIYDNAGQLEYSIDPNGNVTQTLYDAQGQLVETLAYANPIQLSSGATVDVQSGDAAAQADIQAALSASGNSSSTAHVIYAYYDQDGCLTCSLSSASLGGQSGYLAMQTEYDAYGKVIATLQYGDLIPASLVSGSPNTATVEAYLASLPDVHVTHTVYDNAGRAVYSIDAAGNVTQTAYDEDGRVIATTKYATPIGTPAAWTAADVAAAVQAANAGSTQARTTQNVYDDFGNLIQVTDANGNTTSCTYDERGLKLSSTDGNDNTTSYAYDDYGNLVSQTSPPVAVASYSSTGAYQGTTTESVVTSYTYDNAGNLITQVDASNTAQASTTQFKYDAAGNLVQTIQPDQGVIDPQTGLLVATGSNPTITVSYNAFGQAIASEDANGNVAYNIYDHNGNLLYAIDGNGYVTGYTYNAYGQQISATRYATSIDPAGQGWSVGQPPILAQVQAALVISSSDRSITTTYDAQGNKLSVTQPQITYTQSDGTTTLGSPVTRYTYDAYGNVTSESVLVQGAPGAGSAVWAITYNYYDTLGNILMSVDPLGYVTTNTYDSFGDVLSTMQWATAINTAGLAAGGPKPSDPTAGVAGTTGLDRVIVYTYDLAGNKTSQWVQRSYADAQGQATVGWDKTTYAYDGDNRLTSVAENGITTATTAYDALGRITSVTGPQVEVLVSDWQSLLEADSSLTLNSPSLYTLSAQVVSYAYDALGDKLTQTQSSTSSSQSVTTYYQYDAASHMVAQETPLDGSSANWTSDQAKFYAYDGNGNQVSAWYTLSGDDGSTTQVTTTYTYDHDNQQTSSVTWRANIPAPDRATSTTYDAFGEAIASGDGVTNNVVTTYDNAGNQLTSTDPSTGEVHTYGYNLAGQKITDSVPVATSAGGGSVESFYTVDLDGRVTAELAPSTNSAAGENTGTLSATYDAWGNVLSSTDAKGNTISYTYNERNDVVTTTEAAVSVMGLNGQATTQTPVTTRTYDIDGNVVASIDEDGNLTRNTYNALGQKTQSTDGAGTPTYTGYDALGNAVATQDGNGNISFTNVDVLGRAVVTGLFLANGQGGYQLLWQQAYVLDQNGNRIVSYDGIGSGYLQTGDTTDAALHASYAGYDSQDHVIWSQDAAQHAASTASDHQNYSGNWTQTPTNANFSAGLTGWTFDQGYSAGSFAYDGQVWPLMFSSSNNTNGLSTGGAVNNDRVPVVPGQTITASGQFEVLSDHGNGEMFINWYNAEGQMIGQSNNGPGITGGKGSGVNSVTASAPPGAAFAAIAIGCDDYDNQYPGVVCSGVWWDYVPPAGTTVLGIGTTGAVVSLPTGEFTDQADNTNFDQGNTGWDTNGWVIHQASNANSGWEASFGGDGTAVMVNQDRVPVTEGQTISGSMQLGLYLAPDGAAAGGSIAINWYDADGNLIKTDTGTYISDDHKGAWETSYITATAPPGAAFAALAVVGNANGIGSVSVENVQWKYQYIPQAPLGVVQDAYVYDMDGNLVSETTADGDTETWQYNQYGQVTQHTDLSGASYTYTYDAQTGQEVGENDNWSPTAQGQVAPSYVTAPINTPNSETLTYYADGQLASETFADGSSYSYQYDANGNLISEEDTTVDGNDKAVHTLTQTTYDSHNRISTVTETNELTSAVMLQENFAYDAAGNRREVNATSNGTSQDAWYTYDGDNRVEINAGSLVNNQIVFTDNSESYQNAYDADGNVIRIYTKSGDGDTMSQSQSYNAQNQLIETQYALDVTQGVTNNGVETTTSYDADGHALVTSTYYEAGSTVNVQDGSGEPGDGGSGSSSVDVSGELENATVNFYDVVGRLAESQTFANADGWDGTPVAPPTGSLDPNATTYGNLQYQSEVVYQGPAGTSGYDADGDVAGYQYRQSSGLIEQFQVLYLKKDSYLQAQTEGVAVADGTNVQPATDIAIYNTRGNEVAMEQHTEDPSGDLADTVHVFAYNGNGEIIEREDGTGTDGTSLDLGSTPNKEVQNYTYLNGQQLAHFDNAGTLDVLDEVTAFSSNNDSPNSYVVQTGDTLQSIAQAEYGDSNLWYVIAQANDLDGSAALVLGQRLQIPEVTTHSNSSATFKPYDPSSIIGNTTPSLPTIAPPPPPASGGGCGVLGQVVVILAMIAASFIMGPASSLLGMMLEGAVDDAVGQLVGDAVGVHQGFSFGEVALSGLEAGISDGVGMGLQDAGGIFVDASGDLSVVGEAVQGAATYVAGDAASEIVGQPEHFSWAGLIGSAAGTVAGAEVGGKIPVSGPISSAVAHTVQYAVGDVVNREVSASLGDRHVPSWAQVGEQIAGYGLQQAATGVAGVIKAYQAQQAQVPQTNEQLADQVTNQLMSDQRMLNDMIWNGASADVSNQLASEGQAALDTTWAQTQESIDDTSYKAGTEATVSVTDTSANQGPTYQQTFAQWANQYHVPLPSGYESMSPDDLYHGVSQTLGNEYRMQLMTQAFQNPQGAFQIQTAQTIDAQVQARYPGWNAPSSDSTDYALPHSSQFTDDNASTPSGGDTTVLTTLPSSGPANIASAPPPVGTSSTPGTAAQYIPLPNGASNTQAAQPITASASLPPISLSSDTVLNPTDSSPSASPSSLPPLSVSDSISSIHIEALRPDALQVDIGGTQAPLNLMTVPANTLKPRAGMGSGLQASVSQTETQTVGNIVQGVMDGIQSAHNVVTNLRNKAAESTVNLGAWGDQQHNLVGDAAKVLGGIGYVVTAPVDWTAANAQFAGWKGAVQGGLVSAGAWGDRQGGILGGAVHIGAGVAYAADEIFQPGSVADAALIVASPAIGKVVGGAVTVLNKIPGLGTDLGQIGGKLGTAISTAAAGAKRVGLQPRYRAGVNGRLESAFAKIEPQHIGTGSDTNSATRLFARIFGNSTDDAGHAIGKNLGGSGTSISNIVPQSPSVNRGAYRVFEQQIARAVQAGDEVYVRVVPKYATPTDTRPFQILYQVRINGQTITRVFLNP